MCIRAIMTPNTNQVPSLSATGLSCHLAWDTALPPQSTILAFCLF